MLVYQPQAFPLARRQQLDGIFGGGRTIAHARLIKRDIWRSSTFARGSNFTAPAI